MRVFFPAAAALLLMSCAGSPSTTPTKADRSSMTALPPELVGRDLPRELASLQREGRIADAEAWIDRAVGKGAAPTDPLVIERERLRRLRRDYRVSSGDLLATLTKTIPDATAGDLERWREAGHLQWLRIDGEVCYFRREPSNLYRLSAEARERRDAATKKASTGPDGDPSARVTAKFDLHDYVLRHLAEAEEQGTETPGALKIHATHTVTVNPGAVPEGETVRCWIPYPQEYHRQRDVKLLSASPADPLIAPKGSGFRTAYFEAPAPASGTPLEFRLEYVYTTSAYIPSIDPAKVTAASPDSEIFREFTRDQPPHVDLSPAIRSLAAEIVGGEKNPYLAADRIFRWISGNFRYCAEMEYSIITGITDKALNQRAGDCGIHALLFIALCRASGIPARWQSGWAMRPGSENLHDWAEFYVEPHGWLPADPSFGLRTHDDPRVRDFYIGHIDPFRMIANMDYAQPFVPAKTHWPSDNIDNQRGEVEWAGGNLYYDDWKHKMTVEYEFQ